jgi:hypothetical protein
MAPLPPSPKFNNNQVSNWQDINELPQSGCLKTVYFEHNPIAKVRPGRDVRTVQSSCAYVSRLSGFEYNAALAYAAGPELPKEAAARHPVAGADRCNTVPRVTTDSQNS